MPASGLCSRRATISSNLIGVFSTENSYHETGDQAREILVRANVPNASDAADFFATRQSENLDIPLAVWRQWPERAVCFARSPEQFIAQPVGVIARQSQCRGKDTSFVSAFRVDWIKRVIAQLGHVNESTVCVGKFHAIRFCEPPYLGRYAVLENDSASATAFNIAFALFTVS